MTAKKSNVDSSLDSILIQLGDFGKYQVYVFSVICIAMVMHSMIHIVYVFTAMDLKYRCIIPDCDSKNNPNYSQPWLKNAIPFKNNRPEKCSMYAPFTNITGSKNCSVAHFITDIVQPCQSFVYDGDEKTILQEYNLQCENNLWKLGMVGTMNNVGQFFGMMIAGYISDRYGRKVLLLWSMMLCSICGCIKIFMPTYELFLLFEFLDAALGSGIFMSGFVLSVELVVPKKRVLTGMTVTSCYVLGEILVAGSAWLVKSWKPLILICYIPPFLMLWFLWLLPESVRWNLSKGRIKEAKEILRKLAVVNGKGISEKELEILDSIIPEQNDSSKNSKDLWLEAIKSSTLMVRLIACCFCWITCTFLFYGLTLHSVSLVAGNKYFDFILSALVELPAYVACNFVIDKSGRKKSLWGSYLLTGAACLCFIFISPTSRWGSMSVYMMGKFGATAAFSVLYVYTSEMFPTNLRHSFMGTCSTFGRCGSMISPHIHLLAQIWGPLPLVSFVGMSILAGLLTLMFPETLNKKLPDTIPEAENIGKQQPVHEHHIEDLPVEQQNQLEKY